ncbi:MAG: 6-phosphogluconate phosphatase [Candidatus Celerinatantimonas neptuna]|nr:MAG: 6-phosphogluconate phosphatase [Candidatus Celerinatantimonas neptuna]
MNRLSVSEGLIIFDCDGTLVDSEYLCNLALTDRLQDYSIDIDPNQLLKTYRGWKLSEIFHFIESSYDIKLSDRFVDDYRFHVSTLFEKYLVATPHTLSILPKINIKKCVASSGPISKIRHVLSLCKLSPYFENAIFSSYDIDSWKPEPNLFLHAARSMNVSPSKCVVVEDSELGIIAANKASMVSVFYNPSNLTISAKCNHEIKSMEELPLLLNNYL